MKLLVLALFIVTIKNVQSGSMRPCPKLTVVPLSERFLFNLQPPEGFYPGVTIGLNTIPSYKAKPKVARRPGARRFCIKAKVVVAGMSFTIPSVDCSYDQLGYVYCETPPNAPSNVAGIPLPKFVEGSVVETDNRTYMAFGGCLDGAAYAWGVLTTNRSKNMIPATMKALNITSEEVKASEGARITPGRALFLQGRCSEVSGGKSVPGWQTLGDLL